MDATPGFNGGLAISARSFHSFAFKQVDGKYASVNISKTNRQNIQIDPIKPNNKKQTEQNDTLSRTTKDIKGKGNRFLKSHFRFHRIQGFFSRCVFSES